MIMNDIERMQLSLTGLSVGDAFGETLMRRLLSSGELELVLGEVPPPPWHYTDDTEMSLSIVETLCRCSQIDPDVLAQGFARRYNPRRGYGAGAHKLLASFQLGADWRTESQQLFGGSGSYGNGAAMRVAPLGAYFADDLSAARENAILSAQITHSHPEGVAGAIAVAVAAAIGYRIGAGDSISTAEFFHIVLENVPECETYSGIEQAANIPFTTDPAEVAGKLGSGMRVSAQDTVPFALWCAARHLEDYQAALWTTAIGLGDMDTNCAIVGGIVALSAGFVPAAWIEAREPLPDDFNFSVPEG